MFLYFMTISMSLVLIMENSGTPLMSLLDGTFLEAYNRSTESPEGGPTSHPWRSAEAGKISFSERTRFTKMLSRKRHKIIRRTIPEEEERRIERLWDPVLNKSYDFSSFEEYNTTTKTYPTIPSEKFGLEDAARTYKNISEQKPGENSTHLFNDEDYSWSSVNTEISYGYENQTYENGIEGSKSQNGNVSFSLADFPLVDEYPIYNQSSTCINNSSTEYQNQTVNDYNFAVPCLAPNVDGRTSSVKNQQLLGQKGPLKVYLFMNRNPVYGEEYSVFTTMPSLGKKNFAVNLTVDTNDYLIDEIHSDWKYTKNLRKLMRKWGIRSKRIVYNRCYFHRCTARFYNTKHKYIVAKVSSLNDRRKLLAHVVRFKIKVRKPPNVSCLPALELEFCKNPEKPVYFSPMGHLEFFASISDACSTVEYDKITWQLCDITENSKFYFLYSINFF